MEKHTVCHESHEQSIGIRTQEGLRLRRWLGPELEEFTELKDQWGIFTGDFDRLAAVWKDWGWGAV